MVLFDKKTQRLVFNVQKRDIAQDIEDRYKDASETDKGVMLVSFESITEIIIPDDPFGGLVPARHTNTPITEYDVGIIKAEMQKYFKNLAKKGARIGKYGPNSCTISLEHGDLTATCMVVPPHKIQEYREGKKPKCSYELPCLWVHDNTYPTWKPLPTVFGKSWGDILDVNVGKMTRAIKYAGRGVEPNELCYWLKNLEEDIPRESSGEGSTLTREE